jgi:ankyrin repeat protein
MKMQFACLIAMLAVGFAGSVQASEKEETPDVLDTTKNIPIPEQFDDVPGPLSPLDRNLVLSAYKGQLADVKVYVEKGADVNLQDQKERTPLIFAASAGHTPVVKYLIDAGADVDKQDKDGQTALLHACKRSFNETATLLLESGADVNFQSKKRGVTALMIAAVWDNTELVQILLDHGADPQLTDTFGRTAKLLAQKKGNTAVLGMLPDSP